MIWRRKSADPDGSLNGDQRFGFRPSRVPGVEANLTAMLRNSCKSHRCPPLLLRLPLHDHHGLFSRPQAGELNRYLFRSLTKIHDPLPQRTPHSSLRYSTHIRNISVPHFCTPFALHSPQLLRHLSYTALLTHSHTFARFDTHTPSCTRHNSNSITHHPPPHSSPSWSIAYDTTALYTA